MTWEPQNTPIKHRTSGGIPKHHLGFSFMFFFSVYLYRCIHSSLSKSSSHTQRIRRWEDLDLQGILPHTVFGLPPAKLTNPLYPNEIVELPLEQWYACPCLFCGGGSEIGLTLSPSALPKTNPRHPQNTENTLRRYWPGCLG